MGRFINESAAAKKEDRDEFKKNLTEFRDGERGFLTSSKGWDSNHFIRRTFREFIKGGYDDYPESDRHYNSNIEKVKSIAKKGFDKPASKKSLRTLAISEFVKYAVKEYRISSSTVVKRMKEVFGKDLDKFNEGLASDLKDLENH